MPLPITVVSDIVCPWCFIGHRRLAQALELMPDLQTEVDWHPYQLHPYLPAEGAPYRELYARKFGRAVESVKGRMERAGEEAGIDFHFDLIEQVPNTLAAHTVVSWAEPGELRSAVVERFFEGYFLEGKDVGNHRVLADLAGEVGMDAAEVYERLARGDDREQIAAQADENRRSGITGVPFFMIGGRYPIPGAQSAETMVRVIQRVLKREGEAAFVEA